MATAYLSLHAVIKKFPQAHASLLIFNGISALFEQGKTYAVLGVSGTGKSTFLHMLAGFEPPTSGSIAFNGQDIAAWSDQQKNQYLQRDIGLLFQSPYLIRELNVLENVILKGLVAGMSLDICKEQGYLLLEKVGLAHKALSSPTILSGGEQQRVALLRALFLRPVFLLADEPTAHLDDITKKAVLSILLEFQQQYGMGIIMATHDQAIAHAMDTVLELRDGLLVS